MKYAIYIRQLYVTFASMIGFVAVLFLLFWNYPLPGDYLGQAFVQTSSHPVFLFISFIQIMFYSIIILPVWKQFFELFKDEGSGRGLKYKRGLFAMMFIVIISFQLFSLLVTYFPFSLFRNEIFFLPLGFSSRYTFFSFLRTNLA